MHGYLSEEKLEADAQFLWFRLKKFHTLHAHPRVKRGFNKRWEWRIFGICWNLARKLFLFIISSNFFLTLCSIFSVHVIIFTKLNYWVTWLLIRNKRVCVDVSCWMVQFHNVNKSHCPLKDKLYLKSLFHRLRALIALNCSLIFVTGRRFPFFYVIVSVFNLATILCTYERQRNKQAMT